MIVEGGHLHAFGEAIPCVIGRGGIVGADAKREGDGASPRGVWPVRAALLRPDRVAAPATRLPQRMQLPWRWLRPSAGWSDDPADPAYNRPVSHPHGFSAERLWREDHVYDAIVVLGHNDAPPVAGLGSAIFLHATQPDRRPTAGCVAVELGALLGLIGRLETGATLTVA